MRTCSSIKTSVLDPWYPQAAGQTYVIVLGKIEELADLGGPLGSEPLGVGDVGKTGDFGLTLLDDGEGENGQIGTDDASTDGLPLALTSATGTVARSTLGEEQLDTVGQQNTLLHGETLLVVSTSDLEDVALELVTDGVAGDLLAHTLLVENTNAAFIVDLDQLLGAVGGVAVNRGERQSARSHFRDFPPAASVIPPSQSSPIIATSSFYTVVASPIPPIPPCRPRLSTIGRGRGATKREIAE